MGVLNTALAGCSQNFASEDFSAFIFSNYHKLNSLYCERNGSSSIIKPMGAILYLVIDRGSPDWRKITALSLASSFPV